jgi:heat shock protein HslJ
MGIAVLVTGCAALVPAPTLDGRQFLSVEVSEGGAPRPLVPGTRIVLTFDDGSLGAQAGCNHMGFSYRVDRGRLVTEGGAMTEMACDEPREAQDQWLIAFLGSRPTATVAGEVLTLAGGGTVISLLDREVAEPDLPLVGPTWTVDAVLAGDTISSVPQGPVATLRFTADGQVAIETGCNSGSATAEVTTETITFGDVVVTERACLVAAPAEDAMLAVLGAGEVAYAVDADVLTLRAGSTGLLLRGS